ncbi:MAG: hypothetical protein R3208_22100, partial [Ketobacteraceae bacterium]|nr:hypothetical protein [Ketobacteraceae bacterium]
MAVATGCGGNFCSNCPIVEVHALEVSRAENVVFSEADADELLEIASNNLKNKDTAVDVACNLTLQRKGEIKTFSNTRSVDSFFQFWNVALGSPGYVKIVSELNFCSSVNPSVVGCALTPGNFIIVEPYKGEVGAILWPHEFGHSQSLPHRTGVRYLMNPYLEVTGDVVNAEECTALSRRRDKTTPLRIAIHNMVADLYGKSGAEARSAAPGPLPPIEGFVRRLHVTGISYERARQYDASVMPVLAQMLSNPAEELHWVNIVVML